MRNLLRIGRVALPYAFPFHEHQGLHQQVTGTCLTLDVIYRLSLFDVRIETKNGHRPRANFSYNIMRLCSSIMAILAVMAILAMGGSARSRCVHQGLTLLRRANYIRMFSLLLSVA